jgi:excisionase family DNA binding protein
MQISIEDCGNDLLTSNEVGKILRITPESVIALALSGKITAVKVGHNYRFRRDSLEAYLSKNQNE